MTVEVLGADFSVCKATDFSRIDPNAPYCFLARTDAESSLVCETDRVPSNTTAREDGWRAMRIAGTLDFSLVGILAKIAALLADAGVSIFAVSTYDTDYILVKNLARAIEALKTAGYEIRYI